MKDIAIGMWNWIVVGVLLAAIGVLLVTGLGRKRGTRSYRWRMALWTLTLTLLGGSVMMSQSCSFEKEKDKNTIADTVEDTIEDQSGGIDQAVLCYAPLPPDAMEVQIMCYEDVQPPQDITPDDTVLCYGPTLPDVEDVEEDEGFISCYAPLPPDQYDDQSTSDIESEDAMIMCYDPMPDAQEEVEGPIPTCYAAQMPDAE
jgi:hypothetical protein